jgi:hypothetical protein
LFSVFLSLVLFSFRVSSFLSLFSFCPLQTWLLGDETLLEFQREAEVLASLFHANILVMVGITVFPSLCIVTPWAERGALDRYL